MGMSIFKRTSKGLAPTKRGAQFLEQARSILDQLDELEALYHPSGAARIVFSVSIPRASYIAYSFTKFVHSLGGGELDIDFKETNSLETIGSVAEHEYKLGIIRYPLDQEEYFLRLLHERDLQHHLLWEYEPLLLFSREHPLTRQESIYEADLASSTLLEHGDLLTPAARTAPREAASPAARRIFLYERGSQFDLLHSLPNAYIWVSPIPDDMLHRHHLVQQPLPSAASPHAGHDHLSQRVRLYRAGQGLYRQADRHRPRAERERVRLKCREQMDAIFFFPIAHMDRQPIKQI